MKGKYSIGVEISPTCNLRCPSCNVTRRLHVEKTERRNNPNLSDLIISYSPKEAKIIYIGLGEPTIPIIQKRIAKIHKTRKDLNGFIQTNGTYVLSKDILELIRGRRLEIGLSIDAMHLEGGQNYIKIQPRYVESIATAVSGSSKEKIFDFGEIFPQLNRVLLAPLLTKDGKEIVPNWGDLERMCVEYQKILGENIRVYTEVPALFVEKTDNVFYREVLQKTAPTEDRTWRKSSEYGFYVNIQSPTNSNGSKFIRILSDGRVLSGLDLEKSIESWDVLDKYSKPIEEVFPKVFDLETVKIPKKLEISPGLDNLPSDMLVERRCL
ncbi:MAG TPA: hypothetical protein VJZ93_03700 [Candidatus Nanoarchaeia archaeon]|nr:hypothetical protein [Candidatus Nanoarchaeia archaeon]